MTKLKLSPELTLPLDAVTQRFGFIGRIGSGKTYAATKLIELMLDAGAHVVAIDPVGKCYGLRVPGTGPGYPITIFGGLHGDVPLESTSGAMIAELVVGRALSCVIDISQFGTDAEKARFCAAFGERFYFLKKQNPSAVFVYLEECQEIVPQNPAPGERDMLHHWTRMAKLGRNFGIGMGLGSQRPQEVNKKVLNLTECMFTFQLRGKHERDAMRDWITAKDGDVKILDEMPKLANGVAIVDSPQWLNVSQRVKVYEKRTADVSATPKVGEASVAQRPLTSIDLEKIRVAMAATIEKAKADDPRELRKEIAALKKQLAAAPAKSIEKPVPDERAISRAVQTATRDQVAKTTNLRKALEAAMKFIINVSAANFDVAGVDKAELERAIAAATEKATTLLDQRLAARAKTIDSLRLSAQRIASQLKTMLGDEEVVIDVSVAKNEPFSVTKSAPVRTPVARTGPAQTIDGVTVPQQKILNALAGFEDMGVMQVDKSIAAVFSDQSPTSSGYANNLGRLRSLGLIDYPSGGVLALTDVGRSGATGLEINSVEELHAAWEKQLPRPQWNIVAALIEARPGDVERAVLADKAEQSATSSGYANNLGRLRSLGLIGYRPGQRIFATDLLFPEGLR